jgi:hypothetical protein
MQHESDGRDENDDDADPAMERELKALYQAALLDEDFQQHVHDNVQALSDAERQKLSKQPSIQPFLHDELMPAHLQARLRALQAEKKNLGGKPCGCQRGGHYYPCRARRLVCLRYWSLVGY